MLVIVKLVRSLTFGTFVAGGRNRKTRLAVMDATAVDSHRRLVLVRRDDIEHLLLIGGPTDVVVERDIRLVSARRPALTGEGGRRLPPARRVPASAPAGAQPQFARPRRREPGGSPARPHPAPSPLPQMPAQMPGNHAGACLPGTHAAFAPAGSRQRPSVQYADADALTNELAMSLMTILETLLEQPIRRPQADQRKAPQSLDDEMTGCWANFPARKGSKRGMSRPAMRL